MKWTIGKIRAANKTAGMYFFERATMRFFDSRVERMVYQGIVGVYFITSEQFHGSNGYTARRKWTVRKFDPITADIDTIDQFNEMDRDEAIAAARQCARGKVNQSTAAA